MNDQNESDFVGSVLKIALGIFFGVLLLWMVGSWIVRYQLQQASVAVERSLSEAAAKSRLQQEQRRERVAAERLADQRRRDARAAAEADARTIAQHKEAMWNRFFQRSEQCLLESSVDCGNQYIRARREFERRYAAGDLD